MKRKEAVENVNSANDLKEQQVDFGPVTFLDWDERDLSTELVNTGTKAPGVDKPMLVITLVILLIGVIMVLSASYARGFYMQSDPLRLFSRQFIFAVTGVLLMYVTSHISVRTISRWSMQLLLVSIVLLVLVLFIGIRVNGARRWIGIGGESSSLTFQTS